MGPHSSEQGNIGSFQSIVGIATASMGPHSSEQGNQEGRRYHGVHIEASMGPHSSEQGNSSYGVGLRRRSLRFNGASLFRARKRGGNVNLARIGVASMGPHSSEQGNPLVVGVSPMPQEDASMGPHSSEQGNVRGRSGVRSWGESFNGASLFRARKPVLATSTTLSLVGLQWGLTLPSKETHGMIFTR